MLLRGVLCLGILITTSVFYFSRHAIRRRIEKVGIAYYYKRMGGYDHEDNYVD